MTKIEKEVSNLATEDVSLREYVERIFDEREKALQLAFKAQQEALAIATTALNRELEHLNNLRQEINQNRTEYLMRAEHHTAHAVVLDRIAALEKRMDKASGQGSGLSLAWMIIMGLIASAGAIALLWQVLHH